jgi:antitoxin (DNA-binding transcriptional repressor) of toxin-antitoxin stability system
MTEVEVQELKDHLGIYLKRVKGGEQILILERRKAVAALSPVEGKILSPRISKLVTNGVISWKGGRPRGIDKPFRVTGSPAEKAVLESRR